MNWFYRWFAKKCKMISNNNALGFNLEKEGSQPVPVYNSRIESYGMNFTIYRANGGYVVEYRQHDRQKDSIYNKLHIITDEMSIGEELEKIITFESLRG